MRKELSPRIENDLLCGDLVRSKPPAVTFVAERRNNRISKRRGTVFGTVCLPTKVGLNQLVGKKSFGLIPDISQWRINLELRSLRLLSLFYDRLE